MTDKTAISAPGITRQRRPFLAPIWISLVGLLLIAAVALALMRSATTTTAVIVRHADKQLGTIEDPPLSPEGELRAERLARLLGGGGEVGNVAAIFVSDTRRSRQTAAPLAARLRLEPQVVAARDLQALLSRVRREHRGSRVLIVGHSNTVPEIVRQLAGVRVPEIADDDYDDIYVVTVPTFGRASVLRLSY